MGLPMKVARYCLSTGLLRKFTSSASILGCNAQKSRIFTEYLVNAPLLGGNYKPTDTLNGILLVFYHLNL